MNKFNIIILAIALLLSAVSCKDKSADKLPRDVYSQNPEGIIMKSAPDVKSQMVAVIPFAEKVTLTENSDQNKSSSTSVSADKTTWYKTQWNGKTGWIQSSSVGGAESAADQIKISFAEQRSNFSADFIKSFESQPVQITGRYNYPGGEMEPSKIFFLSNGSMVVNSKIFSENYNNTFFHYEFISEGKLLKIKFIDSRLNFNEYADMENTSSSVFKIDKNENTIIYQIKDNGFFFFNWGFVKE